MMPYGPRSRALRSNEALATLPIFVLAPAEDAGVEGVEHRRGVLLREWGHRRSLSWSPYAPLIGFRRFGRFKAGAHTLRCYVMRCSLVLLCVALMGCGGAAPSVRHAPDAQRRCVYVPSRDEADGAWKEEVSSARAGVHGVLVAAAGASPLVPPAPGPAPALKGLSGEGLGNGIPQGVLRLVLEGSAGAKVGTGGAVGEAVVVGGVFVATVGSGLLVCLTARAALDGEKAPIEIADEYYGTHFGDVKGWVQGQYPSQAPSPDAAPEPKPDESDRKRLGRIYVTYTKLNQMNHRYYAGRTSMVVDLSQSLELQARAAVFLREKNHHLDENAEPGGAMFDAAQTDRFDVGTAVDYSRRYDDVAYWRIRGREQQLIDFLGGARSDTGEPYRTENAVRGVSKDNPRGRPFHGAAMESWGELHAYTGY